jgi:prephenate dehydrogenase
MMEGFRASNIVIVGCGLLGGSLGLSLRAAGFGGRIVGVARQQGTLEEAKRRQCIDEGFSDLVPALDGADLVVIATPVRSIDSILEQVGQAGCDAVITDVGSTKSSVVASAEKRLEDASRFVGGHPMAGSVHRGPAGADGTLFDGKPCILTPTESTSPEALSMVEAMWSGLGMRLVTMSASAHDDASAMFSHLPHLAAVLLVLSADGNAGWEVASTGFRDTTRLASSNPPMRVDIIRDNREAIVAAIEQLELKLGELKSAVNQDDAKALSDQLERAHELRDTWLSGE